MGRIFGGYTDISWKKTGNGKDGSGNSFVFSLRDDSNFVKLKCLDKRREVCHVFYYLTAFGYYGSGFII